MKITSLEPQKRNHERLNLYIDGVFHAGIEIGAAARLGLYEGKEISATELASIESEDEYQKCMNVALLLASRRIQSEKEYWQKLGKNYDKPTICRCLERLRELGYADDKKFAEIWVRERSTTRGKRLLASELKQKGIGPDVIEEIIEKLDDSASIENARLMAQKKYKENDTYEKNYSRIAGLLTRKGYACPVVKTVTIETIKKTTE